MRENVKYYPSLNRQLFHFDHVHIKWDQQVPLHQQETWELSYIITGSGARIIGDVVENFSKGEVILIPPNIPHCWRFDESVYDGEGKIENITIVIENDLLGKCRDIFPELSVLINEIRSNTNAVSFGGHILDQLQQLMRAMVNENEFERISSFFQLLELVSHGKDMLVVGRPALENKKEKKLQEIYLFILGNYQRPITLHEIAKAADMQKASFCVFFKKMTGKSFIAFLTEYRINSAIQMLEKTNLTVSEISHQVGFNDVPHFNRAFRKQVGTSPTHFRQLCFDQH